jgi:hypothetical protein
MDLIFGDNYHLIEEVYVLGDLTKSDAPHTPWKTQMRVQKWKQWKKKEGRVCSLTHSISRVNGHVGAPG